MNLSIAHVTNEEIADQLAKHDAHLGRMSNTVDRIEKDLLPMTAVYADIAAVGRVGRCFGNIIKWCAGVGIAVAAMWALLKGHRPW